MTPSLARNINVLFLLGICGVLLGSYYIQFGKGEFPCPLCLIQRLAFIGIAFGILLNLRYGIHPRHYAVSLLSAVFGAFVSTRQILLHIAPGSEGYGTPVFGMHLYSWALLIFITVIISIGLMLLSESQYEEYDLQKDKRDIDVIVKLLFFVVVLIVAANAVTTYLQCGFAQCPDNPTSYIMLEK